MPGGPTGEDLLGLFMTSKRADLTIFRRIFRHQVTGEAATIHNLTASGASLPSVPFELVRLTPNK